MSAAAVEVAGVAKRFGGVAALDEIHLTVHANEFVSLLGPSGCGKSTLLRIISGFESPNRGRILIHGEDVTAVPPERRRTNIVFQRGALFPHMNVFENIAYGLKLRKWAKPRIKARVEELLALVHLDGLERRGPGELSGGQAQRVALARALAAEPTVLLLDEPLSALDLKLRQQMQLELRAIQRKLGATFLYVTHDQTEALVMSDRIAIMNQGRIVQEGSPREIYTQPASVFASGFIGETNLLHGTVLRSDGNLVAVALGAAEVEALAPGGLAPGARVTLSIRPEAVRVARNTSVGGEGRKLAGGVADIVYLGSRVRVGVRIAEDTVVWADLRDEEAEGLDVGVCAAVGWKPSAARAWADAGGAGAGQ